MQAKDNEYVNHTGTNASTPLTPMTPASNCPLLIHKEDGHPPTTAVGPSIPSPYENPYMFTGRAEADSPHLICLPDLQRNGELQGHTVIQFLTTPCISSLMARVL